MADSNTPGMGDIKKEELENLLDKYLRQTRLSDESEQNYPNLSKLYGSETLRDKDKEQTYDTFAKNIKFPPILNKDENSIKDILRNYKRSASDKAANALESDILKPTEDMPIPFKSTPWSDEPKQAFDKRINVQKFAKLAQDRLNTDIPMNFYPLEGRYGAYDLNNKDIEVDPYNKYAKGTVLHELGHAEVPGDSKEENIEDLIVILQPYLNKKIYQDYNNDTSFNPMKLLVKSLMKKDQEFSWRSISDKLDDYISNETLNKNLQQDKPLYDILQGMSKGHFGDQYLDYPIDKTRDELIKELEARGFEKEIPEGNPKFEKLKYLMKK